MLQNGTGRSLADAVAECVLTRYRSLPARYKPRVRDDGRPEWTVLAGVVLAKDGQADSHQNRICSGQTEISECVSLATGLKCLPRSRIAEAKGNILHDWHAEVLCLRGLNRWLLDECNNVLDGRESVWLQRRVGRETCVGAADGAETVNMDHPFELRPDTSIFMYVSAAPCGDASMELVMAAQEDATPWSAPAPSARADDMLGRGHFDQLGVVRRKPSRPDAPSTWSKSCSDKLAAKQCTSLLSGIVARLVKPSGAYLAGLVLPTTDFVQSALHRSFSIDGRLKPVADPSVQAGWAAGGYGCHPFSFLQTQTVFEHAKVDGAAASNQSVLRSGQRLEALINGVMQGRRQDDPRGASCTSRRVMAVDVATIEARLGLSFSDQKNTALTYSALKHRDQSSRQLVKDVLRTSALKGWKTNDGDEDWLVPLNS